MDASDAAQNQGLPAPTPFTEISDLFKWASKRAAPLGFIGLSIATMLWLDFVRFYALPVSFFSTAMLAGLPALFAIVAFLVSALTFNALVPSLVLWTPVYAGGQSLAVWSQAQSSPKTEVACLCGAGHQQVVANHASRMALFHRWMGLSVFFGLFWVCWLVAVLGGYDVEPVQTFLLELALSALVLGLFAVPLIRKVGARRWPSVEFMVQLAGGLFMQNLLSFLLMYIILQLAPSTEFKAMVGRVGLYLLLLIILGIAQYGVARMVTRGLYPNLVKHVVLAMTGLLAVVSLFATSGAFVAGFALRTLSPTGGSCVMFTLAQTGEGGTAPYATFQDPNNGGHSLPFAFATRIDDVYYLKTNPYQGKVYFLPASQVGAVDGCEQVPAASRVAWTFAAPDPVTPSKARPVAPAPTTSKMSFKWPTTAQWGVLVSGLIALLALAFSVRSWRQTWRPVVTARVRTHAGGNQGIALDLVVTNSGSRPAAGILLTATPAHVRAAMRDPEGAPCLVPSDACRTLLSGRSIPLLANGEEATNAFGTLGPTGNWRAGAEIPVHIHYKDLTGRHFNQNLVLVLNDDMGFAQSAWGTAPLTGSPATSS